jgi:DNA-binding beta-propeller fold protein YncE
MFIVGDTGNDINEYTLSTGFDVSSASFVDSFSLASQTTQPKEGVFNTDGTELYVLARDNQKVYKYTLTTGFDVSSASYASVEFSVSSQETSPQGLAFSADGSKMYVCGDTGDDVNQYATTSTATNSTTVTAGKALAATTLLLKG